MEEIKRLTIGLKDMLRSQGEDEIKDYLSSFSCDQNPDVAEFIHKKALSNEKADRTRSFLVINSSQTDNYDGSIQPSNIIGFFSLYIKAFEFDEGISKTVKKKICGEKEGRFFSTILICQFARSDQYKGAVSGSAIMEDCLTTAAHIYDLAALKIVCVEFDDGNPILDQFYLDSTDSHGNPKNFQFTYLQTEDKTFGKQKLAYLRL